MKLLSILVMGGLILTSVISAQEKNTKCKDQIEKLCPGSAGDGNKIGQCLRDQSKLTQLSPDCRPRRVDFPAIRSKCAPEIKTCANQTDDGQVYMCIRKKMSQAPATVSKTCQDQMNQ